MSDDRHILHRLRYWEQRYREMGNTLDACHMREAIEEIERLREEVAATHIRLHIAGIEPVKKPSPRKH
jgi:hypothetical protein